MTKKRIYPHQLTSTQTKSIALRLGPVASPTAHDLQNEQDGHHPTKLEDSETSLGSLATSIDNVCGTQVPDPNRDDVPMTDAPGSPVITYPSHNEALSPSSTFTPSESSFATSTISPTQIDDWRRAQWKNELQYGGRRARGKQSDLNDILNPILPEEQLNYGPQWHAPDSSSHEIYNENASDVSQDRPSIFRSTTGPHVASNLRHIKPRPKSQITRVGTFGIEVDTMHEREEQRKRGRKGPLGEQRRKEVSEVREMGACLRCHIMRIKCNADRDEACVNCRETLPKSRKWTIPCTREWPRERWHYLIPEIHKEHHNPLESFPIVPTELLGASFVLPLQHVCNFGLLRVPVRQVLVSGADKEKFQKYTFDQDGQGINATVKIFKESCLPLIPDCQPCPEAREGMVVTLSNFIDQAMYRRSREWVSQIFPLRKGQHWVRETIEMVAHFEAEVASSSALLQGLRCLMIKFVMNHAFYIPFDEMSSVNAQLTSDSRITWQELQARAESEVPWPAKYVNRWLKSSLLKLMEGHFPILFNEVEILFKLQDNSADHAKLSELDRDEAFSVLIVLFIVTGLMQKSLLQGAIVWNRELETPDGSLVRRAKTAIQTMETEVVDHFLQLWKYRFSKTTLKGRPTAERLGAAERAKTFAGNGVIDGFKKLRDKHALSHVGIDLELDLSETTTSTDRFIANNVTRILLRLSKAAL